MLQLRLGIAFVYILKFDSPFLGSRFDPAVKAYEKHLGLIERWAPCGPICLSQIARILVITRIRSFGPEHQLRWSIRDFTRNRLNVSERLRSEQKGIKLAISWTNEFYETHRSLDFLTSSPDPYFIFFLF